MNIEKKLNMIQKIIHGNKNSLCNSDELLEKHGLHFAIYHAYILDKYEKNMKTNILNKEFYIKIDECKSKTTLSYHHQKKAMKLGESLKWWSCELKYNKSIKVKVVHFILDDKIAIEMLTKLNQFKNTLKSI